MSIPVVLVSFSLQRKIDPIHWEHCAHDVTQSMSLLLRLKIIQNCVVNKIFPSQNWRWVKKNFCALKFVIDFMSSGVEDDGMSYVNICIHWWYLILIWCTCFSLLLSFLPCQSLICFTLVLRFTNKDVHEPCFLSFAPCSPWASPILLERCLIWGHHAFNCLCSCRNVHLSIKCCQSECKCSNPPQVTLTVGVRSQSSAPRGKGFYKGSYWLFAEGSAWMRTLTFFCIVW